MPEAVDAASWLTEYATLNVPAEAFACLDGCGFCCTYPPQVQPEEWQAIHEDTGLTQVGIDPHGRRRLPLQGGCGACVLLEDRACTSYENRPRHCRLFPFHVYFGRTVEVHADQVCPGLDPSPSLAGDQTPTGIEQALSLATRTVAPDELVAHREQALAVHDEFETLAREAGLWSPLEPARQEALASAAVTEEAWATACQVFDHEDPSQLPTMVLPEPGFEWRMWRRDGDQVERLAFQEDGALTTVEEHAWPAAPDGLSEAGRGLVERLATTEVFIGSALDLVDASEYTLPVTEAMAQLADEVTASIALREALLEGEGLPANERWLAAAYEPDFFDLPTIGGWL